MPALLERDAELGELARRLASVRAGAGRVIVVEGPAGIGKSTLLAAAVEGAPVLRARCSPLEQHAAWGLARQLFEPLRGSAGWDELTAGAAGLAELALSAGDGSAHAGDAMHAAVRGLVWLTTGLAERGPVVLVVDDVHWADPPSLRWLALLAPALAELPVGVLCAVRSGEPASAPDLLAEVLAAAPEPPVRPRALGVEATGTLVRARLPDASGGFARACHAVTGGNPFLVGALLAQVAADGVAPDDETASRLETYGADQVARALERRLARLGPEAAALARAVAVLGPRAPARHAAALAGRELARGAPPRPAASPAAGVSPRSAASPAAAAASDPGAAPPGALDLAAAARAADALRAAGLLDPGPELTLSHPLIAAALYSGMAVGERAVRHADAAAVLMAERAGPERVALHLLRTEPARDARTVAVLREAAARASARGAPQSAAEYLRRALGEPPPAAEEEAEVRLELGLALAAFMDPSAYDHLDEAARAATEEQRGRIALSGARALGLIGRFGDAVALCRRGLAAELPAALRERLEAELVTNGMTDVATIGEALRHLRRGAALELWRVTAGMDAMMAGRPAAESLAILRPALDRRVLAGEPGSLLGTTATLHLIASDELAEAIALCDELIDLARPRGWLIALAHGCMMRALALIRAGEIRDAEADARLAFDYKLPVAPTPAMLWCLSFLVDALVEAGDLDGADAALTAAGQQAGPPAGVLAAPLLLDSRARLRLAQHRPEEALADARAAGARAAVLGLRHPILAGWRATAVEALVVLGRTAEAGELAREQAELAERVGTPGARGGALRLLARAAAARGDAAGARRGGADAGARRGGADAGARRGGADTGARRGGAAAGARAAPRDDGAADPLALLDEAVQLLDDSPARLEHTRALVDLGATLRRANRRADAREPLRRALDAAGRGGMALLANRAREELHAAGARPRRTAASGPAALTPAEHRVARLAAEGRTNREIAERLYVTQRTVETHLTHAFQKLGIGSRDELPGALAADERVVALDPAVRGNHEDV